MSGFFLGVDGGQSSTTAVIGDAEGNIVGWGNAGPCNHVGAAEARAKFLRVIRECISRAGVDAGLHAGVDAGVDAAGPRFRFKAACLGMSGGPDDKSALLHELIEADHLLITHDAAIALAGATVGEPGIIVIAGTGSMAFGQNARGETARAGGWGYIFGDEGSAFDIARQGLRAVLREHEGWGGRTALTPALIEAVGASNANEMLHLLYTHEWPRSRVADLARMVDHLAEEGDPTAIGLMQQAAQQLALLIASVRRQLWSDGEPMLVSWTGGAFQSATLLNRFRLLVALQDAAVCEAPRHAPATGALVLAWKTADLHLKIKT